MNRWEPDWVSKLIDRHGRSNSAVLNFGLLTYGSLLIPDEIEQTFADREHSPIKVKVESYKRSFSVNIGPFLDNPDYPKTGVLNVKESQDFWMNGLLIRNITEEDLKRYADREFGYVPIEVSRSKMSPYKKEDLSSLIDVTAIYTVRVLYEEFIDPSLEAFEDYEARCIGGAEAWGESFHKDFLKSTYSGGTSLLTDQ